MLGLVHWDGATLRTAFDEARVSASGLSADHSAVSGAVTVDKLATSDLVQHRLPASG